MKLTLFLIFTFLPLAALANLPYVNFLHSSNSYEEGDRAIVTVELSSPTTEVVSVKIVPVYTSDNADGTDHNLGEAAEVLIAPGSTRGSLSFDILNDGLDEYNEEFHLKLVSPQNAQIGIERPTMRLYISDTREELPFINFVSSAYFASEGQTVAVKAVLSEPASSLVVVPLLFSGTALMSHHYVHTVRELIFYPGMTEATLSVKTIWNVMVEEGKTINIRMRAPLVNAQMGEMRETTITINEVL